MEIKYLAGEKKDFWNFVEGISSEDKIGILTHIDLDGIASLIFLEEILKKKGLKVSFIDYVAYLSGNFEKSLNELKEKRATKVFALDLKLDDYSDFNNIKDNFGFDLFLIDHHPSNFSSDVFNVIKTESNDCVTLVVFNLASEILDMKKGEWLLDATLVAEFSYLKKENLELIKKKYPDLRVKYIGDSIPGRLSKKIGSATAYFKEDLNEVYELLKNKDLTKLDEIHEIVEEDVQSCLEQFEESAEYFADKKLCIAFIKPKFSITSMIVTIISCKPENKDKTFVILSEIKNENKYKVSARNQSGEVDLNSLMKKVVQGLENASGGGHKKASAATFMKKDLEKFRENLLKGL